MKKVSCKDIKPDSACDFEATGESTGEVVKKMFDHIKNDHVDATAGMSNADIRTMIESKVHD